VTYHRLCINDSTTSSISKIAGAAFEIIDSAIASASQSSKKGSGKGNGKFLVHCSAGISRSPMVVAAYLMRRKGMTLKAAPGTDHPRAAASLAECWVSDAVEGDGDGIVWAGR